MFRVVGLVNLVVKSGKFAVFLTKQVNNLSKYIILTDLEKHIWKKFNFSKIILKLKTVPE